MNDEHYMRLALDACRASIEARQSPFGSVLVRDGRVLATAHNHVLEQHDPSAHAEVSCIRAACAELGVVHLPGATLYSTTEPCPMCFACSHWARIERIVYGAAIADAARFGFNELAVGNAEIKELGALTVTLTPGVLRDEAVALFEQWRDQGGRAY